MKKLLTLILTLMLGLTAVFGLVGCNKEDKNKSKLVFGKELVKYNSQLDTLTQLKAGAIDVSIIDSVMAGYYTTSGEFKDDIQIIDDLILAQEKYGIAAKSDNQKLMSKVNDALIALKANGTYAEIANTYGLTSSLCIDDSTQNPLQAVSDTSWADSIKYTDDSSGAVTYSINIGYTVFAPIAYTELGSTELKGFDIDLAKAVVALLSQELGETISLDFELIDWDSKEVLLSNKTIDFIWNGLTITEEREANMCISIPYLNNNQVAVILKSDADLYKTTAKLIGNLNKAIIGVESGSAGEDVVLGN